MHSKEAIAFADKLVQENSEWQREEGEYSLDPYHISEEERYRLAGIIMSEHKDYASSACSPDNPNFDKYMAPSLIEAMKDNESIITRKDFTFDWLAAVYDYMRETVEALLDKRLMEYNKHKDSD